MAKVKVYNLEGKASGEIELDPKIFDVEVNESLVHEVATAQMNEARQILAHAKDRSEVRGGGRKPWRQKGTGRARHGSTRSPIWRTGGVTFGPTKDRNFGQKVNRKVRTKAIQMVLSDKVKDSQLLVLESLDLPEAKTKLVANLVKALPTAKKVLFVTDKEDGNFLKAAKNVPTIKTLGSNSLNTVDLINAGTVIFSKKSVDEAVSLLKK